LTAWVKRDPRSPTGASVFTSSHDRNAAIFRRNTLLELEDLYEEAFAVAWQAPRPLRGSSWFLTMRAGKGPRVGAGIALLTALRTPVAVPCRGTEARIGAPYFLPQSGAPERAFLLDKEPVHPTNGHTPDARPSPRLASTTCLCFFLQFSSQPA
jgi:hypothetical protein